MLLLLWLLFTCQSVCLWHTAAKQQLVEAKSMGGFRHEFEKKKEAYADYSAHRLDADNNQLWVELKVMEVEEEAKKRPAVQVKVTNEVESGAMMRATVAKDDERLQPNGNGQTGKDDNNSSSSSQPDTQIVKPSNVGPLLMNPPALSISTERHNFDSNNNSTTTIITTTTSVGQMSNDEQLLRLQDYNLLYNAERQTYFQLHSASGRGTNSPTSGNRLLQQVVGNTLSAAFGLNTNELMREENASLELTTQTVRLYDSVSLRQSRFNPFKPTRIIIHGWLGNAHANVYSYLVPAYMRLGDGSYNIFTVDWGRGAIADYVTASYRVKPVGQVLAKFVDFLHREAGMRFEDLQLIGFSMGAHVAGLASKHVQTGRVRVIRALDPALPFFRYAQERERLTQTDADYVEVLHTSVGSYGFDRPLGHADFYANWGSQQPGCFWHECSHWRAFALFKESLLATPERNATAFEASGCQPSEWQQLTRFKRCPQPTGRSQHMGGDLGSLSMEQLGHRAGVYYFETRAKAPYDMSAGL